MQNIEVTEDQPEPSKRIRAAEYVRMSTEHQQYSTENQADKIRDYARLQGIEIVRTYADDGKSGLKIGGRLSLQKLLKDVEDGTVDFQMVLVYDVSRWGRFQDADEAAYYEYLLKRKGVHVRYVAEQFDNDGSPVSTIVKGVKRAMAGEYSRELSVKVFAGQCRLIELGYRQGGPAGYGLRRVLLDQAGSVKAELARGEHKSLQTDRVILRPGPDVVHKFGSLIRAYQTVGFTPDRDYRYLEANQFLRRLHPQIVTQTEKAIGELGGRIERDPATDLLLVNQEFTVSLVLARCQTHDNGRNRWKVRFDTSLAPDITVAVRLNHANDAPMDYYLLPRLNFGLSRISLADRNAVEIESYRFDTLDYFYGMAQRTRIRRAS